MMKNRMHLLKGFLLSPLFCACISQSKVQVAEMAAPTQTPKEQLSLGVFDTKQFYIQGPFSYQSVHNYQLTLSPDNQISCDLFLTEGQSKAPLVVFVHGNKFNKGVHRKQAIRFASWGFHALAIEVPNEGQWIENGFTIDRLVRMIHNFPEIVSPTLDPNQIILAGHSFGGSAITIAAGRQTPALGLILLDPAVVHQRIVSYMRQVKIPSILLGADPSVFRARRRHLFFKNMSGPIFEVTIVGATHNDAQYPSITSTQWGIDPFTDRDKQEQFLAAMVASAFSLLHQPPFKIAWNHFKPQAENGRIKFAKIRLEKNLDISGDLGPAAGRNTDHRERMDKNLSSSL